MDLEVTPVQRDGVTVVEVRGYIDVHTCEQLRKAVKPVAAKGPLVIDLDGCDFLDSSGLGVIVGAHRLSVKAGQRMALVAANKRIMKVFAITGLVKVFTICATADEAVLAVKVPRA